MTRMWRGPNAELRQAQNDPLYAEIWRRCGRLGVSAQTDTETGTRAEVFTVKPASGRCGTLFRHDLGEASGPDPWATALHVALKFTPLDAELISQYGRYLDRQLDDLGFTLRQVLKLDVPIEDLIASVRA